MKHTLNMAIIVLAMTLFPLSLAAQPDQPMHPMMMPSVVRVTGSATVHAPPDQISFTLGVQTMRPTVEDAVSQNNTATQKVIVALRAAGATKEQIQTSNFTIYPQQEYRENQAPRVVGYQVNNTVTVRRPTVEDAGKLLQAGINAGANQASGLSFDVSNWGPASEQGLREAFNDARRKATALAQTAGKALGSAITITEGTQAAMPPPQPRQMMMQAKVADASVPVEQGTAERNFDVTVDFEMH
ncbi:MAG: SIMPL domain-containing protein [Acidobacteriota bacterium]